MTPYSVRKEQLMGTAGRTNVNWGLGDQIAQDAEMPYNDLLDGVDTLFSMPTNWGTMSDRVYVEQVMAEEITRMLRGWSRFDSLYQLNVRLFVDEGVSFASWEDDFVWKYNITGLQNLVFPRRVPCDIEEVDIVLSRRQLLPYKLYEKCSNEDLSDSEGWDRDATWEAIKTAAQPTLKANDFQEWEMAWKNHDYILGQTAITVEVIEGWVREVDGSVSHYIARSDGQGDFLYKKEGKFNSMSRMLCPYLYGVGSNGTFHAIHGVLQKTFGAGMAMNKVFCRALDMGIHASTPYMKCETEEAITELPLTPMGQYVAMAPGYGWEEIKVPPFEQGLLPLLNQLGMFLSARSAPYAKTGYDVSTKAKTKYESKSDDEAQARLSSSGVTLFKNGLTTHYREVVRRVINPDYHQSWDGGAEVQEFIARCLDRQVPIEAIRQVDCKRIEVNMGIGRGSSAARRVAADALNALYPRADAKGQNYINYTVASAYAGADVGREVFPFQPGLRPPQDLEDANNENSAIMSMASLQLPQTIKVLPTQNQAIHIESHLQILGMLNEGLMTQKIDLAKAIPIMQPLFAHTIEHLQLLDPTSPNRQIYEEQIGKVKMVLVNGSRELYARQEKMQREYEHNGVLPGGQGGMNGEQLPSALLTQSAELGEKLRATRLDSALKVADFQRSQDREDALAKAEIAKKNSDAIRI